MKIKIITDSTCDLPTQFLIEKDITVLPLHIAKAGQSYLDGLQIVPEDIYQHVESGGEICSTSAVNMAEFLQCLEALSPRYDAIIVITIGAGFSSCYQNACLAAREFSNVYVVDSGNLSSGQGMLAVKAVQLAEEGLPPQEICTQLEQLKPRIRSSFILDGLEYLQKGGRCSPAIALGANLLKLKPCIEVRDGKMIVGKKYRGDFHKAVCKYVEDQLTSNGSIDDCLVILVLSDHRSGFIDMESAQQIARDLVGFQLCMDAQAGCTVACHCGPSTLGMTFIQNPTA